MGDDITIGVTEIVNNIEVTAQPNDQIIDIDVIDNTDEVTLNITPTVIEINVNKGSSYARWGTIYGTLTDQTDLTNALLLKADLVDGKVPAYQLPSFVDDVVEVANYAALPATGEIGKIYVTLDNNKIYRWSGSVYIEIASNNAIWGAITGTLSSQTDLQNALNLKANDNAVVHLTGTESIAGDKTFTATNRTTFQNSDFAQIRFKNTTDLTKYLDIGYGSNGNMFSTTGLDFRVGGLTSSALLIASNENATFKENLTAKSFIKSGGTSSQFLKADGSVDSTTYATDSNVVHKTGDESITGTKTFTTTGTANGIVSNNSGTSINHGGIYSDNSSTGNGIYSRNSSTGRGIYSYNSYTGKGIESYNISGTGIYSYNISGTGIYSYNITGTGIYSENISTGTGIRSDNNSTGTGIYSSNGSTGSGIYSSNSSTGFGVYSNNSSNGIGIVSINESTGEGIRNSNNGGGTGINSFNASTGNGINSLNSGSGIGFGSTNSSTGTGIYSINQSTGVGIDSINSSSSYGIRSSNTSTGLGIFSTNTSSGAGIQSTNQSIGDGIVLVNSSSGRGFNSNNASTGIGFYLLNSSTGKNIVLNNTTAATGMPFTVQKNGTDKFTINDAGGVYAAGSVGIGTLSPSGKLSIVDTYYNTFFKDSSSQYGSGLILSGDAGSDQRSWKLFSKYSSSGIALSFDVSTSGVSYGADPSGLTYSEKMRIAANGNVGIGTTSPSAKLTVNGRTDFWSTEYGWIHFDSSSTNQYLASIKGSDTFMLTTGKNGANTQPALLFGTSDVERMRITSGGFVGIGTSTVGRPLTVDSVNGGTVRFHNGNNVNGNVALTMELGGSNTNNTSSYYLYCDTDSVGVRMVIYGNGNVANVNNSYGAYSDIKLKENIIDTTPKLDDLLKVKIRNYNLIGDNRKQIGVIAQELEEVFPSLIEESDDLIKDEESGENIPTGETTKSVKYSVFVPILIKSIQELAEQVKDLKAEIELLKQK